MTEAGLKSKTGELAPVQRDGMNYEFTIVFALNMNHSVTVSKFDIGDIRNAINKLYRGYLEVFDNDVQAAQEAMLAVTEGQASQEWNEADIKNLSRDLAIRTQKRGLTEEIISEVSL